MSSPAEDEQSVKQLCLAVRHPAEPRRRVRHTLVQVTDGERRRARLQSTCRAPAEMLARPFRAQGPRALGPKGPSPGPMAPAPLAAGPRAYLINHI